MGRGSKSMIMTGVTSSMAPVHWLPGVSNDCPKRHRSSKASRIRHIWCAVPLVSDAEIFDHRTCDPRMEQMHPPPPPPPILVQFRPPLTWYQDHDVPCHPRKKKTGESAKVSAKDSNVKGNDDGRTTKRKHRNRRSVVVIVSN